MCFWGIAGKRGIAIARARALDLYPGRFHRIRNFQKKKKIHLQVWIHYKCFPWSLNLLQRLSCRLFGKFSLTLWFKVVNGYSYSVHIIIDDLLDTDMVLICIWSHFLVWHMQTQEKIILWIYISRRIYAYNVEVLNPNIKKYYNKNLKSLKTSSIWHWENAYSIHILACIKWSQF